MTTLPNVVLPVFSETDALHEASMVSRGIDRFTARSKKAAKKGELSKSQTNLLEASIKAVAAQIRQELQDHKEAREALGGRGKAPGWVLPVSLVDADVLAFIALNAAFCAVIKEAEVRTAVASIGEAVEMEVWSLDFQTKDPQLFKRLTKMAVKNQDTHSQRIKMVLAQAEKGGMPYAEWDDEYRSLVGGILLNAVLKATTLFKTEDVYSTAQITKNYLCMEEGSQEYIDSMEETYALLKPMFLPMLSEPKPWTSMFTGCYHDQRLSGKLALVRTFNQDQIKKIQDAIDQGQMNEMLSAVNSIQRVPLRINEPMFRLLKWLKQEKVPVKGLPATVPFKAPEFPGPEAWLLMEVADKKLWTKDLKTAQMKNRAMQADELQLQQDLATAESLLGKPFALPTSCDFRGRVYPIPAFNHQRSDHIRNLFEFANGKELGEEGAYWLAIHVASTGDFDKVSKESFEDRIAWTLKNTDLVERIGNDPIGTVEEWACADKPFSFVAACIAWAGYVSEGAGYISHLPLPLDGSNSGCQHLAAQTLDEKAGFLVNLTKSDKPQDLYGAVAKLCAAQVETDAAVPGEHQAEAILWKSFGVNRKVVKRSVMVFSYSSEKFGFRKQIITDHMEPLLDDVLRGRLEKHPFGSELEYGKAAGYMAALIWDAVHKVIEKPAEAMNFLKACSGALAHEAKPMNWTTPVGLPVQNLYQEYEEKKVNLFLHDRSVKVSDATVMDRITKDGLVEKRMRITFHSKPTGVVKKSKSRSTVAANWTHSHDAAHLMKAVNAAVDAGMTDLLLIHDSFSTHACDAGSFQRLIKRTFVSMYQEADVLARLREQVLREISEENRVKIPALPQYGQLDLEGIMESDYCFS